MTLQQQIEKIKKILDDQTPIDLTALREAEVEPNDEHYKTLAIMAAEKYIEATNKLRESL